MIKKSKLKTLFTSILSFVISCSLFGQQSNESYSVVKESENTWRIVENNYVNIYVVAGQDSALIIDTGLGSGDLKAFVKTITDLPLIVMNTHGHPDHVAANSQFEKIYLHPDDFYLVENNFASDKSVDLVPIKEGYIFDLGGRKLEVVEAPGHSKGSVVLIDIENEVLFAGDNNNSLVWLFLPDSYPLSVYLKTLQKVEKLSSDFDIIMPGHGIPIQKSFIAEQIKCVEQILAGSCESETYTPEQYADYAKGAMLSSYKSAQVAFNPNNLFEKE